MALLNSPGVVRFALFTLAAVVLVRCVIQLDPFAGKSCDTAKDCPVEYTCVLSRPGGAKTCEVLSGPQLREDEAVDGGDFYCREVKAALDQYCAACHGLPRAPDSGAPEDFRLDIFGGDGDAGAFEKRERIRERLRHRTMPPPGWSVPSETQRKQLMKWGASDGLFCEVPGFLIPDAGPDAGRPDAGFDAGFDAGRPDSGTDAGRADSGSDAGLDAGRADSGFDAGFDAGVDAGRDAGLDAGIDGGPDGGVDGGFDAGNDAGFDGGQDAGADAGTDAGIDSGFDAGDGG